MILEMFLDGHWVEVTQPGFAWTPESAAAMIAANEALYPGIQLRVRQLTDRTTIEEMTTFPGDEGGSMLCVPRDEVMFCLGCGIIDGASRDEDGLCLGCGGEVIELRPSDAEKLTEYIAEIDTDVAAMRANIAKMRADVVRLRRIEADWTTALVGAIHVDPDCERQTLSGRVEVLAEKIAKMRAILAQVEPIIADWAADDDGALRDPVRAALLADIHAAMGEK